MLKNRRQGAVRHLTLPLNLGVCGPSSLLDLAFGRQLAWRAFSQTSRYTLLDQIVVVIAFFLNLRSE